MSHRTIVSKANAAAHGTQGNSFGHQATIKAIAAACSAKDHK